MFNALFLKGVNYVKQLMDEPVEINRPYTVLIDFENNQFITRSLHEENWSVNTQWEGQEKFLDWTKLLTREDFVIIAEIFKEKNPYPIESSVIYSAPSKENQVYQLYVVRADTVIKRLENEINKRKVQSAYIEPRLEQFSLLADEKNKKGYIANAV